MLHRNKYSYTLSSGSRMLNVSQYEMILIKHLGFQLCYTNPNFVPMYLCFVDTFLLYIEIIM